MWPLECAREDCSIKEGGAKVYGGEKAGDILECRLRYRV
jgi:hypothetical protein